MSAFFFAQYWFNWLVIRLLLFPLKQRRSDLVAFGNRGARWKVPLSFLTKNSICYSAGVGEDISFERKLYAKIPINSYLFDPTPRAITFIEKQKLPQKMHFYHWGLWAKNSKQKFFVPPQKSFVSHSIVNLHHTKEYFIADCKSLEWIMKRMGHTHLDLLKIDIEGAEYAVLNHLLKTKIRPTILMVEFDQPMPVWKTYTMILKLIENGYSLSDQTDWNFIFVYTNRQRII